MKRLLIVAMMLTMSIVSPAQEQATYSSLEKEVSERKNFVWTLKRQISQAKMDGSYLSLGQMVGGIIMVAPVFSPNTHPLAKVLFVGIGATQIIDGVTKYTVGSNKIPELELRLAEEEMYIGILEHRMERLKNQ